MIAVTISDLAAAVLAYLLIVWVLDRPRRKFFRTYRNRRKK
jgi:hypothetical protein